MEQVNLTALSRDALGTKSSGRIRRNGRVPAVLYGPAIKGALALSLDAKELDKAMHGAAGGNVLVNLDIGGGKGRRTAMFKAISRHPVSGAVRHVDMIEVVMDKKVVIDVPVHIIGRAEGQALGGIVQLEMRKVRVECLPPSYRRALMLMLPRWDRPVAASERPASRPWDKDSRGPSCHDSLRGGAHGRSRA